jgi:hypothetical protein
MKSLYNTTMLIHYRAKKQCTEQGGKIEHEFKLVKGFTYVPYCILLCKGRLTIPAPPSLKTRSTLCPPMSTSTSRTTARSLPSKRCESYRRKGLDEGATTFNDTDEVARWIHRHWNVVSTCSQLGINAALRSSKNMSQPFHHH